MTVEIQTANQSDTNNFNNYNNSVPCFAQIREVFRAYKEKLQEELPEFGPQIIRALRAAGCVDYTQELVARVEIMNCPISKVVLDTLTRTAEHTARNHKFADMVKERDSGRCQLTGWISGVEAAHILDFARCSNDFARYDINNGLCLDTWIHTLWDTGKIRCVPDWDTMTIRLEITEGIIQEIRDEILTRDPELAHPPMIPVNEEMMEYVQERFELDCSRF
jgi:hypothetical protein